MSKSGSFTLVLTVICLSVLMSLEADAQSTTDETNSYSCSSSSLEEVMNLVERIASVQQEIREQHEENAKKMEKIALKQQENAKEIKEQLAVNSSVLKKEIKKIASKSCESETAEPAKRALVSALVNNCVPLMIQQNTNNGSVLFNRSWAEYKVGFNDSRGNYWLGNDLLSQLTMTGRYKLRFDLQSRNTSNWYYAQYSSFIVLSESFNYTLHVSGYSGNAGYDALSSHNGMKFTTFDRDNDQGSSSNCAVSYGGGFWFSSCHNCCVNCYLYNYPRYFGFVWRGLPGGKHLQTSRMWLQCK